VFTFAEDVSAFTHDNGNYKIVVVNYGSGLGLVAASFLR
jgi:hypothetical protein